jgi:hypothetical protein
VKNEKTYKVVLLVGCLLFLFVPMVQGYFHFIEEKPLKGAFAKSKDTTINAEAWFEGTYQKLKEVHLNENFGFRTDYVRLNNQIDYSFFDKSNAENVIVGRGGFLYAGDYINAYFGNNFIGKQNLEERFKKLKAIQDLFSSQGILLEVVFAPGKATFYPEFIPTAWITEKKLSNYDYASELCKKLGVNFLDFNSWFLKQKDITPYDLFPKTGIHWSNYGSLIAMDSLKNHIEKNADINMRDFVIDNIGFTDSLISPDNDLGETMNLLRDIKALPMPYANYHWLDDNSKVKPKALFIGDSYFWNIYYQGLTNNFFTDCKFWYYNETVYPEDSPERLVKRLNIAEELKKQQVIVLIATECNIHDIGWGFIENVYDLFHEELKDAFRKSIYVKLLTENIKKDKIWLADIERKAKEKNISINEMINLDAIYVYKMEYGSPEVSQMLNETIARIKNTKPWMADIAKKAKEKNVSIDEMIEMDAKYIYDTEQKRK